MRYENKLTAVMVTLIQQQHPVRWLMGWYQMSQASPRHSRLQDVCIPPFREDIQWTVAWQSPLSMGFPRQEHWNGLPRPLLGDLPTSRMEPISLMSPAFCIGRWGSLLLAPPGKPMKEEVKVTQSCLTLWDPMNYTVHEILQTRILEWVAFPLSRESSQPRDRTQVSCIECGFFTSWATREALIKIRWENFKECF